MVILHYDSKVGKADAFKTLTIPGSKYIANRLLILATLAEGKSVIGNLPDNEDINVAVTELAALSKISKITKKKNTLEVTGTGGVIRPKRKKFYTNDNGTFSRFLLAVLSLSKNWLTISGSAQMNSRPMKDLVLALRELGVEFKNDASTFPLQIRGPLSGGVCHLPGNISSQYFSALLLVLPLLKRDSEIRIKGNLVSESYVSLTLALMKKFKVSVEVGEGVFKIKGNQTYQAQRITVPPDPVSASYFMAWAGMARRNLKIKKFQSAFIQNDSYFVDDLRKMNLRFSLKSGDLLVLGSEFKPTKEEKLSLNFKNKPDVVQTFLVFAASLNNAQITINDIAHLRFKETNRVENTVKELRKCGINITAKKNSFVLKKSKNIVPNVLDSHFDHRMVMSLALLSLGVDFIAIKNEQAINKTFPNYFEYLKKLGFKVSFFDKKPINVMLIGYRGSGKTTIAKALAKKLHLKRLSSDEIFEQDNGPIGYFVKKNGWEEFRKKESSICQSLAKQPKAIIDLGAGVIDRKENASYFKNSVVIYLEVAEGEIVDRLEKSYARPSLGTGKGKITAPHTVPKETKVYLHKRSPLYYQACDFKIRNNDKQKTLKTIKNIWESSVGSTGMRK